MNYQPLRELRRISENTDPRGAQLPPKSVGNLSFTKENIPLPTNYSYNGANRVFGKDISNLPEVYTSNGEHKLVRSNSSVAVAMNISSNSSKTSGIKGSQNIQFSRTNSSFANDMPNKPMSLTDLSNVQSNRGQLQSRLNPTAIVESRSKRQSLEPSIPRSSQGFRAKSSTRIPSKVILSTEMDSFELENIQNIQLVPEYGKDIMNYTKKVEELYIIKSGAFQSFQKDITESMRAVLVDWLIDVHLKFKLKPETLFLAVNIMDRYIDKAAIVKKKLQLVGITSLLIASKYEEIYPPPLKEFVHVTDRAYSKDELLELEGKIINTLKFKFTVPSALLFFERLGRIAKLSEKGMMVGRFVLESSLINLKVMRHNPSLLASSAVSIAEKVESKEGWGGNSPKSSLAEDGKVSDVTTELIEVVKSNEKQSLNAVKKKYASPKFLEVSKSSIKL